MSHHFKHQYNIHLPHVQSHIDATIPAAISPIVVQSGHVQPGYVQPGYVQPGYVQPTGYVQSGYSQVHPGSHIDVHARSHHSFSWGHHGHH